MACRTCSLCVIERFRSTSSNSCGIFAISSPDLTACDAKHTSRRLPELEQASKPKCRKQYSASWIKLVAVASSSVELASLFQLGRFRADFGFARGTSLLTNRPSMSAIDGGQMNWGPTACTMHPSNIRSARAPSL